MKKKQSTYCIIIPAYQAVETLPVLLQILRTEYPQLPVIVVNDGSTDDTKDFVNSHDGIRKIEHSTNRGKGAAIKSGVIAAQNAGFTYAICIDADLQHPPEKIDEFIRTQKQVGADMVIGRRNFDFRFMPFHRILSNTITSLLISMRIGRRVHDSQCGFRLINIGSLDPERFYENGFQFESEFLMKVVPALPKIAEVPIETIYHPSGTSSISNAKDTLKFISLFFRSYLWT